MRWEDCLKRDSAGVGEWKSRDGGVIHKMFTILDIQYFEPYQI